MSAERQNRASLIAFLVLMAIFVHLAYKMITPYLLALLTGGLLALLANPVYQWLRGRRLGPKTASSVTTLAT